MTLNIVKSKVKRQALLFMLFITGVILFLSCGNNGSIAGSWEVSGFPDFPFYETYIFHDDKSFKLMRTNENNVKILEYDGIYTTSGKKLKIAYDSVDMGTIEYIFTIDNDKLTLKNSSGNRMTYTKVNEPTD